ncbi:hypothetical protein Taro_004282 [Colocasia esculenta]|uniref:Uncharacterized protein n=1 Tax=Colocasia esculenta TaxID=4460 RepID=A0A843TR92_COLES|nr:hypothetical protein [Colocasia esculenta]
MGQALRRAAGKVRVPEPQPPAQQLKNAERRPPTPSTESPYVPTTASQDKLGVPDNGDFSRNKDASGVLEERDPAYDAMLSHMVGKITSKPGGRPETGSLYKEAWYAISRDSRENIGLGPFPRNEKTEMPLQVVVVEKYNRPLPKLRSLKSAPGYHEDKSAPAGTLNVAQLRQILQLHEGKSEDHQGPMEIEAIAKKFRIDVAEVKTILQFVSLPPENTNKKTEQDQ